MSVRFSKDLSIMTFSDDVSSKEVVEEQVFYLASRLESIRNIFETLDTLNLTETTFQEFYITIRPKITRVLSLQEEISTFPTCSEASEKVKTEILQRLIELKEKNYELCAHFDRNYTPLPTPKKQPE